MARHFYLSRLPFEFFSNMEFFVRVGRRAVSYRCLSKDLPTPCPLRSFTARLYLVARIAQQLLVALVVRSASPQGNDMIHHSPESAA
jgi:hypothetical protein